MFIMLGISPKNPNVLNYLGGLHSNLQKKVILLEPVTMDEVCVQAQYLENLGQNKGKPNGSKSKEHQEDSKEGKKKWKGGEYKNMIANTHQCKCPINHCNNCNIHGYTEEKCWKLHLEMNMKNCKKEENKKNLLDTYVDPPTSYITSSWTPINTSKHC
jgi:hypothetical protein